MFLLIGLFIQFFVYYYSDYIAKKFKLLDIPDQKTKRHKYPTPLTGGIGLVVIPIIYIGYEITIYGLDRELIAILLIVLTLSILGILDDKYSYKGLNKLSIVFIVSLAFFLLSHHHYKIDSLNFYLLEKKFLLFDFWLIVLPLAFSLLIFSLNIADGKNGLVITYTIFLLTILYFSYPNLEYKNFLLFVICGLFIVLFFNIKGKLFLGSSGVNIIAVSIFLIILKTYKHNNVYIEEIILIYYVHIFEVIRLFISRLYSNKSPFRRDTNHLHDIVFQKFNSILSIIYYCLISFIPFCFYKFLYIDLIISFILSLILYLFSIVILKKYQ
tara:strand:- start:596 stop:1576 length:981 start_codon:yes stop_codon:yes gene_type:complete